MIWGLIGLLIFIFWLWMLIECIMNKGLSSTEKLIWVLVIIFLNGLGALLYFFIGRGKGVV
jgi:Phospholipase_D-nuclease N-terminal